jgi:hypothetical protein
MKVTDLPLSSKGKTVKLTGVINQLILNDNGAVDMVLNVDGGTIRVYLDANAVQNYDVEVVDSTAPVTVPTPPVTTTK